MQRRIHRQDLANLSLTNIFKLHGLPKEIISDRGAQFISRFWSQLLSRLNIKSCKSSSRHSQLDSQTERVNQCLEQYLRCYVDFQQDNWVDLPLAEFCYNNTQHSASSMSPFYANYGFHPRVHNLLTKSSAKPNPIADARADHIQAIRQFLYHNLKRSQADMERWANTKRMPVPNYHPGGEV
jgi:transposase InsO family protein